MRAQAVIETIIIFAVGLFILTLFSAIIFEQINLQQNINQQKIGEQSVRILAKEIDNVFFLGKGSKREVLITIPELTDFSKSYIENKTIILNVAGNDVFASTRSDIKGVWPDSSGSFVFVIESFGDFVSISVTSLSFSPIQINESLAQGSSKELILSITNSSNSNASYNFSIDFVESDVSIYSEKEGILNFTPGEKKEVIIELNCSNNSFGNYSGKLIFDGIINITYPVFLNCFSGQSMLTIYPREKNLSLMFDTSYSKSFLICNNTITDFDNVSIFFDGNIRDVVLGSFEENILANSCKNFFLNIIPSKINFYSGKIRVSFSGINSESVLKINKRLPFENNYSNSVIDNNFFSDFDKSFFVRKTEDYWTLTGELDWNKSSVLDNNSWKDKNLVAYYKFNEVTDLNIFDSANSNNGTLVGANINAIGLWDSNAFDSNFGTGHISIPNINFGSGEDFTVMYWFKTNRDANFSIVNNSSNFNFGSILHSSPSRITFLNPTVDIDLSEEFVSKNWEHFAAVRSNGIISIYRNGFFVGSNSYNSEQSFEKIGGKPDNSSWDFFDGQIDEMKFFNRALSNEEILFDYNGFLNSKFVNKELIISEQIADWNKFLINSLLDYNFGKELFNFDGVISLWRLNNDIVDFIDSSVGSTEGVFDSGLWDSNALYCDGSKNIFFNNADAKLNIQKFTFNSWIKPDSHDGNKGFYTHAGGNGYNSSFRVLHDGSNERVFVEWGDGDNYNGTIYTMVGSIPNEKWAMVTITFDGNKFSIFSNGLKQSVSLDTAFDYSNVDNGHFCRCDGCTRFLGFIEETVFWDKVLSEQEILNLYTNYSKKIDLELFSCEDVFCEEKISVQEIFNVKNNFWYDLDLVKTKFFGWNAFFRKIDGLDNESGKFFKNSFIQDFNLLFYN